MASKKTTPARGAGGKFKKSTSRAASTSRARKAATAVIVSPAQYIQRPKTKTRTVVKVVKSRRRVGGGGGSFVGSLKSRVKPLGASAVYAWVMNGDAGTTPGQVKAYLDKVPVLAAIGRHATHGILAAFVASKTKGRIREGFDLLATAALHRAAWNLGASDFKLDRAAALAGDDGQDLSGEIGAEEAAGYEDDEVGEDDEVRGWEED